MGDAGKGRTRYHLGCRNYSRAGVLVRAGPDIERGEVLVRSARAGDIAELCLRQPVLLAPRFKLSS